MYADTLYNVMTKESEIKEVILNLRVKPEVREQFRIAAELKGASMSGLLHQFIIKTIREEKEHDPKAFENLPVKTTSTFGKSGSIKAKSPANHGLNFGEKMPGKNDRDALMDEIREGRKKHDQILEENKKE